MSVIAAGGVPGVHDQDYQAVPLPRRSGDDGVLLTRLARRPAVRPARRAVLYVHCLQDPYVRPDLAAWYPQRGFHFYAADLRAARPSSREATLADYFGCLDSAVRHVREAGQNKAVVVSAHRAGAVIAALWCHARRGGGAAEALVMADPEFGPGQHWLDLVLGLGRPAAEARAPGVLPQAQRRLRRGLDISCPVLVMSPSAVDATARGGYRAGPPARLGPHVTSIRLPSAPPGLARPDRAARRSRYDELSRWLGAYLAADVRDRLL